MIAEKNISTLLSQWKERLNKNSYSEDYKCCLGECMYDLQNLLEKIKQEEENNLQEVIDSLPPLDAEEYLKELEADEYLASLEAHIA